mmetsp:Transcript_30077/g.71576  ORF Transcript_30077/g.71576 Transcript_30077/m.71576 type:complete len:201 (+) Transcript_30077:451-1053(+)
MCSTLPCASPVPRKTPMQQAVAAKRQSPERRDHCEHGMMMRLLQDRCLQRNVGEHNLLHSKGGGRLRCRQRVVQGLRHNHAHHSCQSHAGSSLDRGVPCQHATLPPSQSQLGQQRQTGHVAPGRRKSQEAYQGSLHGKDRPGHKGAETDRQSQTNGDLCYDLAPMRWKTPRCEVGQQATAKRTERHCCLCHGTQRDHLCA